MSSTRTLRIGLIALAACASGITQMRQNIEPQLTCQNREQDSRRGHHCEMREQNVASIGRLSLETDNGSVTIKGWLQSGVLLRARIDAAGENQLAAASLASRVWIDASGGMVRANGPVRDDNSSWSVSYEIFVPQNGDIDLKSKNGSLNISDVRGQIHFDAVNGSVRLNRVAGELTGATVNGSIQIELVGNSLDRQMNLSTHNGSVTVTMPSHFSARVQAETNMGSVNSDFPGAPTQSEPNARPRKVDFNIGVGGPLIHVTTGNGSVRFRRSETQ